MGIISILFRNYKKNKIRITTGADIGTQQNSGIEDAGKSATALGAVLIASYLPDDKYRFYVRGELYNDPDGMLSGTFTDNKNHLTGLKLMGFTLGIEYKPTGNSYVRLEGRELITDKDQEIFYYENHIKNYRTEILFNLGVSF